MSLSWPPCCKNTVSGAWPPCRLVTMSVNCAGTPRNAAAVWAALMPILSSDPVAARWACRACASTSRSFFSAGSNLAASRPLSAMLNSRRCDAVLPSSSNSFVARLIDAEIRLSALVNFSALAPAPSPILSTAWPALPADVATVLAICWALSPTRLKAPSACSELTTTSPWIRRSDVMGAQIEKARTRQARK